MIKGLSVLLIVMAFPVHAGNPCSDSWYRSVEEMIGTGDGQGHGPDAGSDEWKSVIEFRLGIRGEPDIPDRGAGDWCDYIDWMVSSNPVSPQGAGDTGQKAGMHGPSNDCAKAVPGSIEALVCEDDELSELDLKLSGVYAAASVKAVNEHPPVLKAEQRGWIKGRDDCWKSDDRRGCVRDAYLRRIAELQARYRLVDGNGPLRFTCDGNPASEVTVTFFRTEPPTLVAERGDSVSLMYLQPSGSGTRYAGRNETFWEHQGEATITWGYGAQPMQCTKAPENPGSE
ncbi:MAG TPA: MliC family protein [Gammaproteobacteria bacterium]|nr:MliC family protein [Gammaproteobacteria bacterium]